jgi:hypothetical protein
MLDESGAMMRGETAVDGGVAEAKQSPAFCFAIHIILSLTLVTRMAGGRMHARELTVE